MKTLCNKRGQGLVEYMILIALMAGAAIVAMRYLSHTVNGKITEIVNTLQGKPPGVTYDAPEESVYKRKDLGNFLNGAATREN